MMKKVFTIVTAVALMLSLAPAVALANNGDILLSTATYGWTDPASGQEVEITENVYKTGDLMKWEYVVYNIDYDPEPGITNGFSGFQIQFPVQVAEVANQMNPGGTTGPWQQNAFSGVAPPWGVEWDAPHPGIGIMPGQTGVFSYTTEERERVVLPAPDAGWAHTWGLAEPIIDLDGTATAGVGGLADQEVYILAPLTSFPTGGYIEGLDWFDNDASLNWTAGDDLHVEDPTTHPGAIRDGVHNDFLDPIVLDLDNSLDGTAGNESVHVDLETGTVDPSGSLNWTPAMDPEIAFFDSNGNNYWDDGEDIVLDTDLNGEFGWNTQTYMFYGENSVPGDPYMDITKTLVYAWPDPEFGGDDWILDLNEKWYFQMDITVTNPSSTNVTNVMVKDNFGGDLEVVSVHGVTVDSSNATALKGKQKEATYPTSVGDVRILWTGKTEKAHLFWDVDGTLIPGETHTLTVVVSTDMNTGHGNGRNVKFPDGHQEYTSEGEHCLNSGATAKGIVSWDIDFEVDYSTDSICVNTGDDFTPDVLIYYGNGGFDPGTGATFNQLRAHYAAAGYLTDYTDVFPADLSPYKLIILVAPGADDDGGSNNFTTAQVSAFQSFMQGGGRLVVMGDHSGSFGINTVNDLLGALGVGITQNADAVTMDGDTCPYITDITPDQITTGVSGLDLSATSSLNVTGSATSLVRLQAGWTCGSGTGGETVIAVDQIAGAPSGPGSDVVVIGDTQGIDDFALSDPWGDGIADNLVFADNLVGF